MNRVNPEVIKLKEDISMMRNKLTNVEEQIKEEEKVNSKLRSEAEAKLRQLQTIDEAIISEASTFKMKQKKLQAEIGYLKDDTSEKMESLQHDINQLQIDLAGADIIQEENSKLHERIKHETKKSELQRKAWQEELERMKAQNFDVRVKLEEVFRTTIKIFDKDSRIEAVEVMESEAAQAEIDNVQFLSELRSRALFCSKLLKTHEIQSSKLSKLKLIKEVMTTGSAMQEKSLLTLGRDRDEMKM